MFDQHHQHVDRASTERCLSAFDQHHALRRPNLDLAEAHGFVQDLDHAVLMLHETSRQRLRFELLRLPENMAPVALLDLKACRPRAASRTGRFQKVSGRFRIVKDEPPPESRQCCHRDMPMPMRSATNSPNVADAAWLLNLETELPT